MKNSDIKQNCGSFVEKAKFKIVLSFVFLFFFADVFAAPIVQAFFSPNGKITAELIKRIANSKKNIFGAVYTFTDATVAQALVDACKRGVDVRIVVDRSTIESQWGKAKILIDGGVNVFCKFSDKPVLVSKGLDESFPEHTDQKLKEIDLASIATPRGFNNFGPIMHHKYAIFDDKTVWTGSFNWTLSANNKNSENVVVIDQMPEIVLEFNNNFKTLISASRRIDIEAYNALVKGFRDYKEFLQEQRFFSGSSLSVKLDKKKAEGSKLALASKKAKPVREQKPKVRSTTKKSRSFLFA